MTALKKIADILALIYFVFSTVSFSLVKIVPMTVFAWITFVMLVVYASAFALESYAKGQIPPLDPPSPSAPIPGQPS